MKQLLYIFLLLITLASVFSLQNPYDNEEWIECSKSMMSHCGELESINMIPQFIILGGILFLIAILVYVDVKKQGKFVIGAVFLMLFFMSGVSANNNLSDDLISYFTFYENATDIVSGINNISLSHRTHSTIANNMSSHDGNQVIDYGKIPEWEFSDNNNDFTVSFWFKNTELPPNSWSYENYQMPVSLGYEQRVGWKGGFRFAILPGHHPSDSFFNHKMEISFNYYNVSAQHQESGKALLSLDKIEQDVWYFVTLKRNSTGVYFYLNNTLQDSIANDFPIMYRDTYRSLFGSGFNTWNVGSVGNYRTPFKGNLSYIAIHNRSLSEDEIELLYNEGERINLFSIEEENGEDVLSFTTIPTNETIFEGNDWNGVQFEAENYDSFFINDTTNFNINSSGFLNNISVLNVGEYHINVSINNTEGDIQSTIFVLSVVDIDLSLSILSGTLGDNDWYVSNVEFNLTCSEGCGTIYYCIDEDDTCTPDIEYTTNVEIINEGELFIRFMQDNNPSSINSEIINIDKIKPVTNIDIVGSLSITTDDFEEGLDGWSILTGMQRTCDNSIVGNCSMLSTNSGSEAYRYMYKTFKYATQLNFSVKRLDSNSKTLSIRRSPNLDDPQFLYLIDDDEIHYISVEVDAGETIGLWGSAGTIFDEFKYNDVINYNGKYSNVEINFTVNDLKLQHDDFEKGNDGWSLSGNAERMSENAINGSYSIHLPYQNTITKQFLVNTQVNFSAMKNPSETDNAVLYYYIDGRYAYGISGSLNLNTYTVNLNAGNVLKIEGTRLLVDDFHYYSTEGTSGINRTYYCIDQSNTCTPNIQYTSQIELEEEGDWYIRYYSVDNAGNEENVKSELLEFIGNPIISDMWVNDNYIFKGNNINVYINSTNDIGAEYVNYTFNISNWNGTTSHTLNNVNPSEDVILYNIDSFLGDYYNFSVIVFDGGKYSEVYTFNITSESILPYVSLQPEIQLDFVTVGQYDIYGYCNRTYSISEVNNSLIDSIAYKWTKNEEVISVNNTTLINDSYVSVLSDYSLQNNDEIEFECYVNFGDSEYTIFNDLSLSGSHYSESTAYVLAYEHENINVYGKTISVNHDNDWYSSRIRFTITYEDSTTQIQEIIVSGRGGWKWETINVNKPDLLISKIKIEHRVNNDPDGYIFTSGLNVEVENDYIILLNNGANFNFHGESELGEQISNDILYLHELNTPPEMIEVLLPTTSVFNTTTIIGESRANDIDGQNLNYEWRWYINNIMIIENTDKSISYNNNVLYNIANLSHELTNMDDEIIFSVRAYDGEDYSDWLNSSMIQISSTPEFTFIPDNETIMENDEWLGVYFEAENIGVYSINDTTNFNINNSGYLNWTAPLSHGVYNVNVDIGGGVNTTFTLTILENPFEGGNGLEGNPYQISNWEQLSSINLKLDSYYIIINDITSSSSDYDGLGNNWTPLNTFTGNLDGQGYLIEGLEMNVSDMQYVGMFSVINTAEIRNLNIIANNISVQGLTNDIGYVAVLSGQSLNTITDNVNITLLGDMNCGHENNACAIMYATTTGTNNINTLNRIHNSNVYMNGSVIVNDGIWSVGGLIGDSWNGGININNVNIYINGNYINAINFGAVASVISNPSYSHINNTNVYINGNIESSQLSGFTDNMGTDINSEKCLEEGDWGINCYFIENSNLFINDIDLFGYEQEHFSTLRIGLISKLGSQLILSGKPVPMSTRTRNTNISFFNNEGSVNYTVNAHGYCSAPECPDHEDCVTARRCIVDLDGEWLINGNFHRVNTTSTFNLMDYINITNNNMFLGMNNIFNAPNLITLLNIPTIENATIYNNNNVCNDCMNFTSIDNGGDILFSTLGAGEYFIYQDAPEFITVPNDTIIPVNSEWAGVTFTATNHNGFMINDTDNFNINSNGELVNITMLDVGEYYINVSVYHDYITTSYVYNLNVSSIPVTTLNMIFGEENNDWYNTNVIVSLTSEIEYDIGNNTYYCVDDNNSCNPETIYSGHITINDNGDWYIRYYTESLSGGIEEINSQLFKIDRVSPVTSGDVTSGVLGNNDWYITDVEFNITATDEHSGINITYYCIDTDNICTPTNIYTTSLTLSNNDNNYVRFRSEDNAGNDEEIKEMLIKIDKILPNTTGSVTSGVLEEGKYISTVEYTLTAYDEISGVYETYYCMDNDNICSPNLIYEVPLILNDEGEWYIRYYSIDNAGNNQTVQSSGLLDVDFGEIVIIFNITGEKGLNDWFNNNITFNMSVTEESIGLDTIKYCIDNNNTCDPNIIYNNENIFYNTSGQYYIRANANKTTGEMSEVFFTLFRLDNIPPVYNNHSILSSDNYTNFTIYANISDNVSGVKNHPYLEINHNINGFKTNLSLNNIVNNTFSNMFTINDSFGYYDLILHFQDNAGNNNSENIGNFTIYDIEINSIINPIPAFENNDLEFYCDITDRSELNLTLFYHIYHNDNLINDGNYSNIEPNQTINMFNTTTPLVLGDKYELICWGENEYHRSLNSSIINYVIDYPTIDNFSLSSYSGISPFNIYADCNTTTGSDIGYPKVAIYHNINGFKNNLTMSLIDGITYSAIYSPQEFSGQYEFIFYCQDQFNNLVYNDTNELVFEIIQGTSQPPAGGGSSTVYIETTGAQTFDILPENITVNIAKGSSRNLEFRVKNTYTSEINVDVRIIEGNNFLKFDNDLTAFNVNISTSGVLRSDTLFVRYILDTKNLEFGTYQGVIEVESKDNTKYYIVTVNVVDNVFMLFWESLKDFFGKSVYSLEYTTSDFNLSETEIQREFNVNILAVTIILIIVLGTIFFLISDNKKGNKNKRK